MPVLDRLWAVLKEVDQACMDMECDAAKYNFDKKTTSEFSKKWVGEKIRGALRRTDVDISVRHDRCRSALS